MWRNAYIGFWLAAALPAGAAAFEENFATNPFSRGWRTFGDASLYTWNATGQNMQVTWDSSRTNSFFHLPLGTILGKSDTFSFSFEVRLSDIRVGSTPGKSNEFQIAVGLLNSFSATNPNSFRGSGVHPTYGVKNLVEFNYFPDAGFGDTFASVIVSTNNRIYPAHNFPLAMTTGDTFRITMSYTASNEVLRTSATRNGVPFGMPPGNTFAEVSMAGRSDFRVDSFALISYSDAIQTGPQAFHGSVLAHGVVDNLEWNIPPGPVGGLRLQRVNQTWQADFVSHTNWSYTLERSADLIVWTPASATMTGNGARLNLVDADGAESHGFYRIRSERP